MQTWAEVDTKAPAGCRLKAGGAVARAQLFNLRVRLTVAPPVTKLTQWFSANDYTVLGDSVNLAARLVAAAGPGQTLLSDDVYRGLSGRGVCDALGEIQLKGFEAPTRAWRLRGLSGEPLAATRSSFCRPRGGAGAVQEHP
jgi:class 3 adenylate cyclase